MFDKLLSPYHDRDTLYKNRIVLAPLTRCMADDHQVPTENMRSFYTKRAGCGLLITEATCISPDANAYDNTPGIYSKEQINQWKKIVSEVQQNGARFFLQLWHSGMLSHSSYRKGKLPISPSGIKPLRSAVPRLRVPYETPLVMTKADIEEIKEKFCEAAYNSTLQAGFDGVEIHAANGYLIDTFLHHATNLRSDEYGGSCENMCRFLLELIDAIATAIGGHNTIAVRLSPITPAGMEALINDQKDELVFQYLLKKLNSLGLAYVHMSSDDDEKERGYLSTSISSFIRSQYKGPFIAGGNYDLQKAEKILTAGHADLTYFGKILIANPTLPEMLRQGITKLTPFDFSMVSNPP